MVRTNADPRAGELTTTHYGWTKPTVGLSVDVWGDQINTDLDGIDSVVHGIQTSVPASSTTTPIMDGTATVGSGTTWARADHVHPTDARIIGDNHIVNGDFAINQRAYVSGTAIAPPTGSGGYGHDRWKAGGTGCTYTFTTTVPDTTITITAGTLTQIIEAGMIDGGVYTLSWTGTAQARIYQGTPTGSYVASPVVTASLTAGTNTVVEFNTGTVTRVKLEIGGVATPYNRQSLAKSMADCQRYYQATGILLASAYGTAAGGVYGCYPIPVMRVPPTVTFAGITYTNCANLVVGSVYASNFNVSATVSATAQALVSFQAFASAEL